MSFAAASITTVWNSPIAVLGALQESFADLRDVSRWLDGKTFSNAGRCNPAMLGQKNSTSTSESR